MSIEKEFVPHQESLELKELGFDEPCIMQWTYAPELIFCTSTWAHPKLKTNKESYSDSGGDCISAPTFSQAFRWFREKYRLHYYITTHDETDYEWYVYDKTKMIGKMILLKIHTKKQNLLVFVN